MRRWRHLFVQKRCQHDSITSQPVQIADLISGVRRRVLEGDTSLRSVDASLGVLHPDARHWPLTHTARRWTNRIAVIVLFDCDRQLLATHLYRL